ncbi:MAG: phosphoribosylanthranilate isomerase [Microbacteriaceae bacterium]
MFVKICGLRTPEMVTECVQLGVNAIGFVFAESSVRFVAPPLVRSLVNGVPQSVETVGVFLDAPVDAVISSITEAGLSTAQLHGEYSSADIAAIESAGIPVIRALTVSEYLRDGTTATRVLIDGDQPGSGAVFDAALLEGRTMPASWILAGGLTPENVAGRIGALSPGGVDVSSGVESMRGVKSAALVRAFVGAAR